MILYLRPGLGSSWHSTPSSCLVFCYDDIKRYVGYIRQFECSGINDNDVCTRERAKDVMTPQNPLGVAGWAVPEEVKVTTMMIIRRRRLMEIFFMK